MRVHKEVKGVLGKLLIVFLTHMLMFYLIGVKGYVYILFATVFFLFTLFVFFFFRKPNRNVVLYEDKVVAPADGTVVVIEEVEEKEYFEDKRIQISIFMSVWNVHINWFPMIGEVVYKKYHPGKFLLARNPKSSLLNERTTVVVENKNAKVLFRQIAGIVARRIVSYAKPGVKFDKPTEAGFIKFGSRVDILLPVGAKPNVEIGQKTRGSETVIAYLPKK